MIQNDAFKRVNRHFGTSHLHSSFPDLSDHCHDLKLNIREIIFNIYGDPPEGKKLSTWIILLDQLQRMDSAVEIFTTNYDMVLEHAIDRGRDIGELNIKTGSTFDGQHALLDMKLWDNPGVQIEGSGRLTKLHGSVNWQRRLGSNNYIFISPVFTGDLQKQVALYPGEAKEEPKEEPFVKFYKHFERSVEKATGFIFIGFSFRDEYINRILQENAAAVKNYIITKNSPHPLPSFLKLDKRVKHNDKGFTPESVSDCLTHLL